MNFTMFVISKLFVLISIYGHKKSLTIMLSVLFKKKIIRFKYQKYF